MSTTKNPLADFAPKLVEITEKVLFGDVWERPQLSKRDRSLITCAALVALGKTEQMDFHFPRAIENGVTEEELVELITHLAFYGGWPNAMSAGARAKELLKR
jgi:4-carboxymuconolactone decarboxylase